MWVGLRTGPWGEASSGWPGRTFRPNPTAHPVGIERFPCGSLHLWASPRATLHLVRAGKAVAAMSGRDYVLPDDLRALAPVVLTHRLLPSPEAARSGRSVVSVLHDLLEQVRVPDSPGA